MDTTFRPSLLSDTTRARWQSPAFAVVLHMAAVGAFTLATLTAPTIIEEPTIVVELMQVAVAPPEPVAVPPPPPPLPQPAPVAKPIPTPVPKLAVKAAALVARPATPTVPSPTASPSLSETVSEAPAAPMPSQPEPAGAASTPAPEQVSYIPPSASAAYLSNPKPHYPAMARRNGWEGVVRLLVQVNENGRAISVSVKDSSGHSVLDHCAQAAVEQWRFSPAKRGGQQIAASVEVPIRFNLREG